MASGGMRTATYHAPDGPRQFELWGGRVSLPQGSSYTLEEAIRSPVRVSRTTQVGPGGFYRSASMVRKFEQGDIVATFVEKGGIIRRGTAKEEIEGPAILIGKSSGGYHAEWRGDIHKKNFVYQLLFPPHLLATHIDVNTVRNITLPIEPGKTQAAFDIIKILFSSGRFLDDDSLRGLVKVFVEVLVRCLESDTAASRRQSAGERHFERFAAYVEHSIHDPSLNAKKVAQKLGISARRLSQILSDRETSFSSFVNDRRLQLVRGLLVENSGYKVAEIAAMCGFPTIPHFHRLFRKRYGTTPLAVSRHAHSPSSQKIPGQES